MNDLVSFLRTGKFKSFVFDVLRRGKKIPPFVVSRLFSLYGFGKGRFSLTEILGLLSLGRFRSAALQNKFWQFLNDEAKNELAPFLTPDGGVMLYGSPFYVPLLSDGGGGYYYLATLLFEVIVFDQYHAADYLRDGAIVVDAGANIGTFSALVANTIKDAKIYAFEPAALTYAALQRNTKGLEEVSCRKLALGNETTYKKIYVATLEDSGFGSHGAEEGERVEVTTLDKFVSENNIPRIDFIKIDTEGYEKQILGGARETIAKWKPVIAMSAYHHPGDEKALRDIVLSISSDYICDLHKEYEADLICYPAPHSSDASD
jgi:FkbM family methyltransferase